MLRLHLVQRWHALSDPAMEEALYGIAPLRPFARLSLLDANPGETTAVQTCATCWSAMTSRQGCRRRPTPSCSGALCGCVSAQGRRHDHPRAMSVWPLKATTVAEGIEDAIVWNRRRELGCAIGPRGRCGRPAPAAQALAQFITGGHNRLTRARAGRCRPGPTMRAVRQGRH